MVENIIQLAASYFDEGSRAVEIAIRHSLSKHGPPTTDPVRGALNVAEEAGEVAAAALDATRRGVTPLRKVDFLYRMCDELEQVAGYAMLLRQSMKEEINRIKQEKPDGK